jgi:hypothetical protein
MEIMKASSDVKIDLAMKSTIKIVFILILLSSCRQEFAKVGSSQTKEEQFVSKETSNEIDVTDFKKLKLTLHHSMRFQNKTVEIDFQPNQDSTDVHLKCDPMVYNGRKWKSNPLDTTYVISNKDFKKINASIKSINFPKMTNHFNTRGKDGTMCYLEFGSWQNSFKMTIWSPNLNPTKRHLNEFLKSVELILKAAQLDPKEIL